MEFGKKLLIGGITLLVGFGMGEYVLYKKFEYTSDPIKEVVRWPYNQVWAELDSLQEQYAKLKENQLISITGKIKEVEEYLKEVTFEDVTFMGFSHYYTERVPINFVELKDGKRFAYIGDFFAVKNSKVRLEVLSLQELAKAQKFLERVDQFRLEHHDFLWVTRGYEDIITGKYFINEAIEYIPSTKLKNLDGLIENYDIL